MIQRIASVISISLALSLAGPAQADDRLDAPATGFYGNSVVLFFGLQGFFGCRGHTDAPVEEGETAWAVFRISIAETDLSFAG